MWCSVTAQIWELQGSFAGCLEATVHVVSLYTIMFICYITSALEEEGIEHSLK